jgi:outer membrane scaffolding protein for murein synthesis (MipA/OmpV family)
MTKLFPFSFFLICGIGFTTPCIAQTPTPNLMPDGSYDLYIGLGAESRPLYEGAGGRRISALPVAQAQWSNGVFIAGTSAGIHLSEQVTQEYGPLITWEAGRSSSGTSALFFGVTGTTSSVVGDTVNGNSPIPVTISVAGTSNITTSSVPSYQNLLQNKNKLIGLDNIHSRPLFGGFYNFNLSDRLRITNNILYGAGNQTTGLRWTSDLRYRIANWIPHHTFSISSGVTLVNQAYNQAYFGVTRIEAVRSGNRAYSPSGGIKDVHAELYWNWSLNTAWLLTSRVNASVLTGNAADSPLVERRSNVTVSSALAYRF